MYLTQTPFWTQRVSMTEMHEFIYMRDPSKCYNTHTPDDTFTHRPADFFLSCRISHLEHTTHIISNCIWDTLGVKEMDMHTPIQTGQLTVKHVHRSVY